MKDTEVIKTLKKIAQYSGFTDDVSNTILSALDLINRQQAQLADERAKIEICAETISRQDAEIERLRNENKILSKNADTAFQGVVKEALDIINHQQKKNDDLLYKLTGVMHSVDKWLDGDELKQDEVNRAATMREKTLRLIESARTEAIKEFAEMQKDMKDKLIDLLINADVYDSHECKLCTKEDYCDYCIAEKLANYLIENGVIILPTEKIE